MDFKEHSAGPPAVRLSAEQIMQAAVGDVIWHPGGFLVELVRCYPGTGYWFWHRVSEGTLTRHGPLEGGPWLAAAAAALSSDDWARREIELLSVNQKRRETLIAQLQQLHAEMVVLGEISNVLYGNIIRTGKKMLP